MSAEPETPKPPAQPGAPPLSIPVPPEPVLDRTTPASTPGGEPPLSMPVPPPRPTKNDTREGVEPPLSVPVRP